ncbi:MAG: hypothetical protein RL690_357 [Actinomycetota bacterium]
MSVVVIGVFDGVHKGHQEVLNQAKKIAGDEKIIALTFDPHPTTVFVIGLSYSRFTMPIKLPL